MSAKKITIISDWWWIKNLSDLKIYKEKQVKQKKQKTINFLKKTMKSEATICFKWKKWLQNINQCKDCIEWTFISND